MQQNEQTLQVKHHQTGLHVRKIMYDAEYGRVEEECDRAGVPKTRYRAGAGFR